MPSLTAAPPATLAARHLRYERGGRIVLDDVSLTVGPATCLGVVGPNGVGKSTLLQLLAGLLDPDRRGRAPRPADSHRRLPQPGARVAGEETVRDALLRRTGVAVAEDALAAAAAGSRQRRPRGRRPLRRRPEPLRVDLGG